MTHIKKWSAGTIFDNNKCHLDEEVLRMTSINANKKEKEFSNKVKRYYCEFHKKKKILMKQKVSWIIECHMTTYLLKY